MAVCFGQRRTAPSQETLCSALANRFSGLPSFKSRGGGGRGSRNQQTEGCVVLVLLLCRCQGGDDLFKAWIATQRVPVWQQLQFAIVDSARRTDGDSELFAG